MRSNKFYLFPLLLLLLTLHTDVAQAKSKKISASPTPVTSSEDDYTLALRDVLFNGTLSAIKELGRDNGFLKNLRVKIPMPKALQPVEKSLRFIGRGKVADDFIAAMNHAAERAVPEAIDVFKNAVKQMTFTDARNIVRGSEDAATQFFRRASEDRLRDKFLPIVQKFTEQVGVTAVYKRLIQQAGPVASLAGKDAVDLDGYVTQKALDGLFLLMADEERRIRRDPVAQTTAILRKVFGIGR
jgi:hypothetical protein